MTRRERQRRRRKHEHPLWRGILGVVALLVVCGVGAAGVFALWVVHTANSAPNLNALKSRAPGQTSEVFAANAQPLGYMASDVLRTAISQQQQPTKLRQATVAIEDRRFYQHGGVDYEGLVRAAIRDIFQGGGIQGGSTLTMQLVTNVYLPTSISDAHNLRYKIVQVKLANELEAEHSKDWVLTQYLNDVPYGTMGGRTAIGVSAASEMLFDKPVGDLDLAQTALLAGLPQAPSAYNPFEHPQLARWRRGLVLQAMAQSGYITRAQAAAAQSKGLEVKHNDSYQDINQPYVFDYVQQQLKQDLSQSEIDQGGLKIYTTINLADQAAAQRAIQANEGRPGDPAASLVSIDPSTGDILALQNSTTYGTGPGETTFDYATQAGRQTGSAFKVFALMTLIHDQDGDPNSTYYVSKPLEAGWLPSDPTWSVHDAEASYSGTMSIARATALSDNTVFAQLGVDLGVSNINEIAHAMGITSQLTDNPSEVIGGLYQGVSALQMSDAYATLANGGDHVDPTIISKVYQGGKQIYPTAPLQKTQVFSSGEAYAGTQALEGVIQYGTGTGASYGCPAAGKTGTTTNYTDAWFVGYTPKLSTAVWVGYPNSDVAMNDVNGLGPGYGGTLAAPIWKDFMQSASDGYCGQFPQPSVYWHGGEYFGQHAVSAYVPPPVVASTTPATTATTGATTPSGGVGAGAAGTGGASGATGSGVTGGTGAGTTTPVTPSASNTPAASGGGG